MQLFLWTIIKQSMPTKIPWYTKMLQQKVVAELRKKFKTTHQSTLSKTAYIQLLLSLDYLKSEKIEFMRFVLFKYFRKSFVRNFCNIYLHLMKNKIFFFQNTEQYFAKFLLLKHLKSLDYLHAYESCSRILGHIHRFSA